MKQLIPINLLIADDHRLMSDGISKLLEDEKSIDKIYTVSNGKEAVNTVLKLNIDCVIMDINMPVLNGLDATIQIKQHKPDVKIIVVSMLNDASSVSRMLKAGANAFLGKDTNKSELLHVLRKVMEGEQYISPTILPHFLSETKADPGSPFTEAHLTPREKEILVYIAEGLTNQEIAKKLYLSTSTIDTHRKNMLAKLHLKNTAALVKYAAENKLI